MGKPKKNANKGSHSPRIENRKAWHDYEVLEKLEVGVVLVGSEVKSVRAGQVALAQGYARIDLKRMELHLCDVDIAPYSHASAESGGVRGGRGGGHERKQVRKLLAHKRQITKLAGETSIRGVTLVPLAMYFVRGIVKLELGVVRGKKSHDKRETVKKREAEVQIRRAMVRKVI